MSGRNPDLPILDELGAEFEAMVTASATDRHATRRRDPAPPSSARRERGAQAHRIGRRAAIVLVLVCLIGGVAFAALRGGDSTGGLAHTSPALLGHGAAGAWSFSVYRDEGKLCTVFVPRGGELSGNCGAAPAPGRLRAGSAIAAGHRYVFGIAGPVVGRASVSLGEAGAAGGGPRPTGAAGIRQPVDPDAADDAGLPAGDGWFVLDLGAVKRGGQSAAPAVVVPFTRHGHRAGPPYVDCSLGILAPACKRRIESAARG